MAYLRRFVHSILPEYLLFITKHQSPLPGSPLQLKDEVYQLLSTQVQLSDAPCEAFLISQ